MSCWLVNVIEHDVFIKLRTLPRTVDLESLRRMRGNSMARHTAQQALACPTWRNHSHNASGCESQLGDELGGNVEREGLRKAGNSLACRLSGHDFAGCVPSSSTIIGILGFLH